MKQFTIIFITACFSFLLIQGCSQRVGDFTLISTKNVDIGGKYKKLDSRFIGEDSKPDVLLIPLGFPSIETAVDRCIEEGNGNLLTDVVIEFSYWTAIFYGQSTYTVSGNVWTKAVTADLHNPEVEVFQLTKTNEGYMLISLQDDADIIKVSHILN